MIRESTVLRAIVLSIAFLSSLATLPRSASAYSPHVPISIDGDADFTASKGVVQGSGTSTDPFVIEGWEIDASSAHGILIQNTRAHFVIRDVRVHSGGATRDGIFLFGVANGRIENAVLSNNWHGVRVQGSDAIAVSGGSFQMNVFGLHLAQATNVSVTGNTFSSDGVFMSGSDVAHFASHSIASDNLVNGRLVRYEKNCSGLDVEGAILGQLLVANCTGIRVQGLAVSDTTVAVEIAFADRVVLRSNQFTGNLYGAYIQNVANATLEENRFAGNDADGLQMAEAVGVAITDNVAQSNGGTGISVANAMARIEDNSVTGNGVGVVVYDSGPSSVSMNTVAGNTDGVQITFAANITVARNNITSNSGVGVRVDRSRFVTVHHNNFVANQLHATDAGGLGDAWDDGYPSGGNYWDNYSGQDNCSGPGQNVCPDPDGLGDTPFVIAERTQDRYPLMAPADVQKPTIEIRVPTDGSTLASLLTEVSGVASDNVEVSKVEISTDERVWVTASGTTTWSGTLTLVEGRNTIYARAVDVSGNIARDNVSVTVHSGTPGDGGPSAWTLPVISALVIVAVLVVLVILLLRRRRRSSRT